MLRITIPETEIFNEATNEIITVKKQALELEHSLVSVYEWESTWCKPFLSQEAMSAEEELDYIRCMTITENVDPICYRCITPLIFSQIKSYIERPMTATWFRESKQKGHGRSVITAEIIYYWMVALTIPFECQHWHLNKLLTLVRVCNEKNSPQKKMSARERYKHNRDLNNARRQMLNTKG